MKKIFISSLMLCSAFAASSQIFAPGEDPLHMPEGKGVLDSIKSFGEWGQWMEPTTRKAEYKLADGRLISYVTKTPTKNGFDVNDSLSFFYDNADVLTKKVSFNASTAITRTTVYSTNGTVTETTETEDGTVSRSYKDGKLISSVIDGVEFAFTSENGENGSIIYTGTGSDGESKIIETIDANGNRLTYEHTKAGVIIEKLKYNYDFNDQNLIIYKDVEKWNVAKERFSSDTTIEMEYDLKGRLIKWRDENEDVTFDYAYDENNNLTVSCDLQSNFYSSKYKIYYYSGAKEKEYGELDPGMYPLDAYPAESYVAKHGKLQVSGTNIVDIHGEKVVLRGMSTHDILWFRNCYTASSLDALVDDWNIKLFRLASYAEDQIKYNNGQQRKDMIDEMVDQCAQRGIYCMIDWHVLNQGTNDPWATIDQAIEFFEYMSKKHAGKAHVIYEICNEPNGSVSWARVKSYAEQITEVIRKNDPNSIIIVGTPVWSQRVDAASVSPLADPNTMYAMHFYASSHKGELRSKADFAISNGLPIFVTEFGTCDASGNGGFNVKESLAWFEWMNENDISWANWNFGDKKETACVLQPGSCAAKNWNNLTESGKLLKCILNDPTLATVDSCFYDEEEEEDPDFVEYVASLKGVEVAPNPVKDVLKVNYDGGDYSVCIFSAAGKLLWIYECEAGRTDINVSFLNKGMYIVKVSSYGKFMAEKIEKE